MQEKMEKSDLEGIRLQQVREKRVLELLTASWESKNEIQWSCDLMALLQAHSPAVHKPIHI